MRADLLRDGARAMLAHVNPGPHLEYLTTALGILESGRELTQAEAAAVARRIKTVGKGLGNIAPGPERDVIVQAVGYAAAYLAKASPAG